MLLLRPLRISDEISFRRAIDEFKTETPHWDFAFQFEEGLNFEDYVSKVQSWEKGIEGFVPASYLVAVVGEQIVGRVSIRHELNDFLREYGGHIGYGVIPSERGKGYATQILKRSLSLCSDMNLEKIMISCDIDNIASKKVIEKNGGIFERETNLNNVDIQKYIYNINTSEKSNKSAHTHPLLRSESGSE